MSGPHNLDPMMVLEQELVASQQRTAEIAADMEALKKLKEITAKYGLTIVSGDPVKNSAAQPPVAHLPIYKLPHHGSVYTRAKAAGEAVIRAAGKPMQLSDVFDELVKHGIEIGGKTPKNTLSAYLGQNPNLVSTPRGWWLKATPVPAHDRGPADHSKIPTSVLNPANSLFPKESA
jgi:hypothetical protein